MYARLTVLIDPAVSVANVVPTAAEKSFTLYAKATARRVPGMYGGRVKEAWVALLSRYVNLLLALLNRGKLSR
jgi:hypothetical protein